MPHADGTGSGSLLDSILSTLLEKRSRGCLGGSCFFSTQNNMVTLDCILNGCCDLVLCTVLHLAPVSQKRTVTPQRKAHAISCVGNHFGPSATFFLLSVHSLNCFHFRVHCYHLVLFFSWLYETFSILFS